jgi:hypothetical protein
MPGAETGSYFFSPKKTPGSKNPSSRRNLELVNRILSVDFDLWHAVQ